MIISHKVSLRIRIILMAAVIPLLMLMAACTTTGKKETTPVTSETNPPETTLQMDQEKSAKFELLDEKITKAIEEAKRNGKTSVDIYLDEVPTQVQPGDLVNVRCRTTLLEGGKIIAAKKSTETTVLAGKDSDIPGLEKAVLGLSLNDTQVRTISPENTFGIYKEEKLKEFPLVHTIPVTVDLNMETYKKKYNSLPEKGNLIRINPYFKSRIIEIENEIIKLENLAKDGYTETAPFGKTVTRVNGGMITLRLEPVKGAAFDLGRAKGYISDVGKKSFVVDFNHPLAGKSLNLDIEVLSIIKASRLSQMQISWIDDHEDGVKAAFEAKKNKVLVLYADWCRWCEKLFDETFEDPRIKMLKNEFVWVKANSDTDRSLKDFYKQDGFPMIVLTDYNGFVLKTIDGFRDARNLLPELERIMIKNSVKADS